MNIRLDENGKTHSYEEIENNYSTYTKQSIHKNVNRNQGVANADALSMQLGGILSDPGLNAYGDNNDVAKDNNLKETLKMKDTHNDYMMLMSGTVSDKELKRLSEDGFSVSEMDPEEIVTVVDEIKANLAKAGKIIPGYNDDVSKEALEKVGATGVSADQIMKSADIISKALDNYDLPDSEENRDALDKTGKTTESLEPLTEGNIKYLLRNNMKPTVDNIYLAEHSGSKDNAKEAAGYYSNDGYYSKKASDDSLDNLLPRIKEVIEEAGYTADEEAIKDAKWMVQNSIELTADTFRKMEEIKNLPLPATYEQGVNIGAAALKNTGSVDNAIPGHYKTIEQIATEKIDELNGLIEKEPEDNSPYDDKIAFSDLSYRRQLEETRLVMTVANTSLLIRNDIDIDFKNLEELVDNLKVAEETIRENMFKMGSVEANNRAAEVYEYANKIVSEIPSLPVASVALFESKELTLDSFHEEGVNLRAMYAKANESYEPLMTEVRADLGDSISKAFERMDSLLEENGIEVNEANEKAARILGYNEMAITAENIDRVREADEKLERVIGKMTPSATLSLIRDGINPVTMDLDELEARLNERQNTEEKEIERYNSFLVKLDDAKEISSEEREGYIGIYRMIHQIESKDSAAIGALLEQGGEMTLGNLLTQVRSRKASGREAKIDDSFGLLDTTIKKKSSITDQIDKAFNVTPTKQVLTAEEIKANEEVARNQKIEKIVADARESINNASESKDMVKSLLDIAGLMPKIANVNGAKALSKDRGMLLRTKNKMDKALRENDASKENNTEADFMEALNSVKDSFTDEVNAKSAYDMMATKLESEFKENVFNISDTGVVKDIRAAIGALGVAKSLARNEHFEIPMEVGGEESSVSVHLVHDGKINPEVRIYTETEIYGRISATFTAGASGLEGLVETDRNATLTGLQNKLDDFMSSLSSKNISVTNVFFSHNINAGLKPLVKNPSGENVQVDTKELYQTAKSFLEIMTKL